MKFSITGQEKGDLLIQVTTWAGLTVFVLFLFCVFEHIMGMNVKVLSFCKKKLRKVF
jgi:hypothetical protein